MHSLCTEGRGGHSGLGRIHCFSVPSFIPMAVLVHKVWGTGRCGAGWLCACQGSDRKGSVAEGGVVCIPTTAKAWKSSHTEVYWSGKECKTHPHIHAGKVMWGVLMGLGESFSVGRKWVGWCMAVGAAPQELPAGRAVSISAQAMMCSPGSPEATLQARMARLGPLEKPEDHRVLMSDQRPLMGKSVQRVQIQQFP